MTEVDACFRELVSDPRAQIRAPKAGMPIQPVRDRLDAPLRAVVGPDVFQVIDLVTKGGAVNVPLRLYKAIESNDPAPVIVFLHGGGFVAGSLDTHDAMCRVLCEASQFCVLSVGYRLAPEHPYPAAVDDCGIVFKWLAHHGESYGLDSARVGLCGDSAGGYIAISAILAEHVRNPPLSIVHLALLYPVVDPACDTGSMDDYADGYVLTREVMRWFWQTFGSADHTELSRLSLLAQDLSSLPSTLVLTAEFDPLRDEGEMLHQLLRQTGVVSELKCFKGMVHGFASLLPLTIRAREALRDVADSMSASLMSRQEFSNAG
jgi:acetyl esterase